MIKAGVLIFLAVVFGIACAAAVHYPGSLLIYALFTLVANALLIMGFQRRAIFFDTFTGIFLWLGFWLKFSLRTALSQTAFLDVHAFDRSPQAFDHVLIVSTVGLAALLATSVVRRRFFVYPDRAPSCESSSLFHFYRKYRYRVVAGFLALVIFVAVSNVWLGIYQRGMVPHTSLPYGLNGIYKWLLQFGLASFSAVIIRFEIELNRRVTWLGIIPALLEVFASNVSLLSRGMILNSAALAAGVARFLREKKNRFGFLRVAVTGIAFAGLFAASVLMVNYLRASAYESDIAITPIPSSPSAATVGNMTVPLFIDRWVGIEGVVAVSSSPSLGWDLWQEAWRERLREGELSIYDSRFIESPYTANLEASKFHFVSLPGIIAFLYYPGSLAFLFVALFFCGLFAAAIEIGTYRYAGKNWILCSLIAQVIAFRYAHFGYVPAQSYLLFGTIILNVAVFVVAEYILRRCVSTSVVVVK